MRTETRAKYNKVMVELAKLNGVEKFHKNLM